MSKSSFGLAVHKSDDGLYSISWSGGCPLCVAANRDDAAAALRDASDYDELTIKAILDEADSSASEFLGTALVGITTEWDALAESISELPTHQTTDALSARVEVIGEALAAVSTEVTRQRKESQQMLLRELNKRAAESIERNTEALVKQRIPYSEAAAIAAGSFFNSADGQELKRLRAELANG
jgi:uncharacterized membrane-anchored protein